MKNKTLHFPQQQDYYHRFVHLSQEWYWELDSMARIVHSSPQVKGILAYEPEELVGRKFVSLMSHADDSPQDAAVFAQQRIQQKETIENLVCSFYDRKQRIHYLELNAEPYFDDQGNYLGYHGVARNLPAHANLESTLHNLADGFSAQTGRKFFRSLVTHLADLFHVDYALVGEFTGERQDMVNIIVVQSRGEISENFCYPIKGTPCEEVYNGQLSCYDRNVQNRFPNDPMLPEMHATSYLGAPLYDSNGKIIGLMAVIHSKPFAHITYIQSIFRLYVARAASELERQQMVQNLERLAHQDDLTGLYNRNLFLSLLEQSIARARRNKEQIGLIFLDLDHFKDINDTLGHEAGDRVLTLIAKRLKDTVREEDAVARIGGDEFMVLLEQLKDEGDCRRVAEKIITAMSQPIRVDLHDLHVTTSLGISVHPNDGNDASTLMKNADIALYRAKSNGRNTYQLYSADMGKSLQKKLNLESELRRAVSEGEFELFYQTKFDLSRNRTYGVEALLRWNHPHKGRISPDKFIYLLEETGAIVSVGDWVLQTALTQIQSYNSNVAQSLNLSVNISAKQLREPDFLTKLDLALSNSGFDPNRLELEITESVLIEEGDHITELLNQIKERGIRLALDDFGTGYSSLLYLRRFPIDSIKIDKSFIRCIKDSDDDQVVVKTLIELARALRLGVVAEGVETQAQLDTLKQIGCLHIQGYYFSKPVPFPELPV